MPQKPVRHRMDPAVRAELILDEALRQFAERHYGVVTVRDIAVGCGVNAGLIYYYFASKDELFRRTLEHALALMHAAFEARRPEGANPAAEIDAYLDMHAALAPTIVRMVKIMADYAASPARDGAADETIATFYAHEQALLEACLARGVGQGVFRAVDVAKAARTIGRQLDGIFYASTTRGDGRVTEDLEELRSLIGAILAPEAGGEGGQITFDARVPALSRDP